MRKLIYLLCLCMLSCSKDDMGINSGDHFEKCTDILGQSCREFEGEYCLFGYKWGRQEKFSQVGKDVRGPRAAGGKVTFSFQEKNGVVHTHREANIPSESFDLHIKCAKVETIKAMYDWAEYADIDFEQQPDNSDSDIKIYAAFVSTGGIGFPNIKEPPCQAVAGQIILDPSYADIIDCLPFYKYALHEIGHTLGLGHSAPGNIMGNTILSSEMDGLQAGDIKGVIEIYGLK